MPPRIEQLQPANRDEWLALRRRDVTASVAGCLLGEHDFATPYQLWAEKTGRLTGDDTENEAMRRGRLLEPVAIAMLREDRPDWTITATDSESYFRDPVIRLGATPDALARRPDRRGTGIVQIKTTHESIFAQKWLNEDGDLMPPLWIAIQAIVEAHLTGSAWAAIAVMVVGRGIALHVADVPVHDGLIARIRHEVEAFWTMTDAGEEPPVDWERDGRTVVNVYRETQQTAIDLPDSAELDDWIETYQRAGEQASAAKKVRDQLRPRIIHALGVSERAFTDRFQIDAPTVLTAARHTPPGESRRLSFRRLENLDAAF